MKLLSFFKNFLSLLYISYVRYSNLESNAVSKDNIPRACCHRWNWPLGESPDFCSLQKPLQISKMQKKRQVDIFFIKEAPIYVFSSHSMARINPCYQLLGSAELAVPWSEHLASSPQVDSAFVILWSQQLPLTGLTGFSFIS